MKSSTSFLVSVIMIMSAAAAFAAPIVALVVRFWSFTHACSNPAYTGLHSRSIGVVQNQDSIALCKLATCSMAVTRILFQWLNSMQIFDDVIVLCRL